MLCLLFACACSTAVLGVRPEPQAVGPHLHLFFMVWETFLKLGAGSAASTAAAGQDHGQHFISAASTARELYTPQRSLSVIS